MDKVGRVCAVVDAQGFTIGRDFIVRELAIRGERVDSCLLFKVHSCKKLRVERAVLDYQSHFVHGLSFRGAATSKSLSTTNSVTAVLVAWHRMVATTERPLFACLNPAVAELLRKEGIPFLDLHEVTQLPSSTLLRQIYPEKRVCKHHKWTRPAVRCAQAKACQLWQFLCSLSQSSAWGHWQFQTPLPSFSSLAASHAQTSC
jgi:hypothetical protein